MTLQNTLEIKGNLSEHPLAELIVEAAAAELSGSFRLSFEENKVIVYLRDGKIVFAVSNSRKTRLFQILLNTGIATNETLAEIADFTNDQILAQTLVDTGVLTAADRDAMVSFQVKEIIGKALEQKTGEWIFSPQMRIKEGISCETDTAKILFNYAREKSSEFIVSRFKSLDETFSVKPGAQPDFSLLPEEGFVLSLFGNRIQKISEIQTLTGLPDKTIFRVLYVLWMSGFLTRRMWNSGFTEKDIFAIKAAKLAVKKQVVPADAAPADADAARISENAQTSENQTAEEKEFTVEDYLKRIENAEHYYEMLDVDFEAELPEIKAAYFSLAQKFHPDKFHHLNNNGLQQRIQEAFTEIARSYETLKSAEKREVYNFKVRKYLENEKLNRRNSEAANTKEDSSARSKAAEEFEKGFSLLEQDNYAEAVPFLSRAVQMEPLNARYHAYYGKAISADESQRFKAEQEIQTGIKLEPDNQTFRVMLAEFYIQYNLLKRAEGELQRLLKTFPDNREAQNLLADLTDKQ